MKLSQIVTIRSHPKGTLVATTTKKIIVPMSLRRTVNELCLVHGSSLEGRIAFAKTVTKKHRMLPIYVSSTCILLPSGSLKSYDTVLHNWFHLAADDSMTFSSLLLEKAQEIAHHENSDYAILQVLKGSHIHE
jgi:hypothetical protein